MAKKEPETLYLELSTRMHDFCLVKGERRPAYLARFKDAPKTWERSNTPDNAIGALRKAYPKLFKNKTVVVFYLGLTGA